jgi:hypothetical protein
MLQGYFDDSGSEPTSYGFVIAGYLLAADQWALFSDEWALALAAKPKIKYFKMYEAFSGEGQFETMGAEFRKAKTRDMLAVILKYRPVGLTSFMTWQDFKRFAQSVPEPLKRQPYSSLFFKLIDNALLYQQAAGIFPEKMQLDFDDQGSAGSFAIEWYGRIMNQPPPLTFSAELRAVLEGTPRMLDDINYVPLQAADMLAWFVRSAGTPGVNIEGWDWLYTDLASTLWEGCQGYSEQSWDQILRAINVAKDITNP